MMNKLLKILKYIYYIKFKMEIENDKVLDDILVQIRNKHGQIIILEEHSIKFTGPKIIYSFAYNPLLLISFGEIMIKNESGVKYLQVYVKYIFLVINFIVAILLHLVLSCIIYSLTMNVGDKLLVITVLFVLLISTFIYNRVIFYNKMKKFTVNAADLYR